MACKMGEIKIRALRTRAQQLLGGRFDMREFHAEILKDGAMPLDILEAKMKALDGAGIEMREFAGNNRQAAIFISNSYELVGVRLSSAYIIYVGGHFLAAASAPAADLAEESTQQRYRRLDVAGLTGEQSGSASATVRIHARREVVWSLITSCPESVRLVPGLRDLRCTGDRAGSIVAKDSACHGLLVVRAETDL